MIFVSVGTADRGFDRLLQECDGIGQRAGLDFFAQTGSSAFRPKYMAAQAWLSREEMQRCYQRASAFVVHGGFGTLSETLKFGKPIFVVPRRFEDGEAVNDQSDLAAKLHSLGLIHHVEQLARLEEALLKRQSLRFQPYAPSSRIPTMIRDYAGQFSRND